jgi:hypothetical protein
VQVLQESLFEAQRILIEEEKRNLSQAKKLVKNHTKKHLKFESKNLFLNFKIF